MWANAAIAINEVPPAPVEVPVVHDIINIDDVANNTAETVKEQ